MNSTTPTAVETDLSKLASLSMDQKYDPDCSILEEPESPLDRPDGPPRATEPAPSDPTLLQAQLQQRPRSRSPYSRSHHRSHSAASALYAPAMTRTKSLPLVTSAGQPSRSPSHSPIRPSSPLRPSPLARSNPRRSFEEAYPSPGTPSFMDIESIEEDSELEITPRNINSREAQASPTISPMASIIPTNSLPRSNSLRRRPPSPLTQYSIPAQASMPIPSVPRSASPQLQSTKFNEPYPLHPPTGGSFSFSASSSIPSTPTSLRSRSPSISSLETIPDIPDGEQAAVDAHNIARLKAAADAADAAEADAETAKKLQRAGFDVRSMRVGNGLGISQTVKDKRKRWSVCGAERRGDFEMETIWED